MKYSRNVATAVAGVTLSITLLGCGAKNEVAAPDGSTFATPSKAPTTILAGSLLKQTGVVNSFVPAPPAVVVLDQNGAPMSGVQVSFDVTSGDGLVAPNRVLTDRDGIARTSWRLGETSGENTLSATVSGIKPLIFIANCVVPEASPAARATQWDLLLIGGQQLPLTYSGGGSTWTITGGHYVFLDDSTYAFGYDVNGVEQLHPMGRYVTVASGAVQFYLAPGSYPLSTFYAERGGLFSTATIKGNLVTVTYEDFIDFEIETYVISPP
jgi:hypothetical protein